MICNVYFFTSSELIIAQYLYSVRNFCIKLPLHAMEVFLNLKYFYLEKYKVLFEF